MDILNTNIKKRKENCYLTVILLLLKLHLVDPDEDHVQSCICPRQNIVYNIISIYVETVWILDRGDSGIYLWGRVVRLWVDDALCAYLCDCVLVGVCEW